MKTLIKNAWILTMDKTLSTYPQGMLVIEDDKISYVGEYDSDIEKYVDEVIDPAITRMRLIRSFEMLANKRQSNPPKKHSNLPL